MVTVDLPREGHVKKYRVSSWVGLGLNVGLWAGWLLSGGVRQAPGHQALSKIILIIILPKKKTKRL